MSKERLTIDQFKKLVATGKMFTVMFVKRSTGEERVMNCRTGVTKYDTGGEMPYDPEEKNLLSVFDLRIMEHRLINLEKLRWLKIDGKVYDWNNRVKAFVRRA